MRFSRHILFVAILASILFPNLQNQSVYAQDTEEIISDNSSNKKELVFSMKPLENSVGIDDVKKFVVTVTDSDSQPITDVRIFGSLTYPDGTHKHTFEGITDENGKLVFPLTLDNRISLGELKTQIKATKPDYKPLSLSGTFRVVMQSDASPNGESDDVINNDNIRYNVQGNLEDRGAYSFDFAGDYGCESITEGTVNAMKNGHPDLVLALGDLSEVKDPDCFYRMLKSLDNEGKLKIAFGYHDMSDGTDISSRFSQYLSYFGMTKSFYSFDFNNIHFVVMNTGFGNLIPYGVGSQQYEFIKSDLAHASINDKIDWILVCGYRPVYTSPTVHRGDPTFKGLYPQLFEKYGVDLVITAHNHNYQRTYPLYSDSTHNNGPQIRDTNRNNYNNPMAPIYVTVGTAGEEIHQLLGQAPFVSAQLMKSGFLEVQVLKDGTQLNGKFVDSTDNTDKDYFTIYKP